MLVSIVGPRGSGKTTFLTLIATKSKREIFSNYKIKVKKYRPLQVIDLLNLKDNINVFIDEGYTWLESRTSTSVLNRYLTYIVLQSRKRTIDIYITAQMFSSVDVRFREQSDVIIKAKKVGNNFHYTFYEVGKSRISRFILPEYNAKKIFGLFDTYEIVEPHQKEALEFKLIQQNPKKLLEKIKELTKIVKPKLNGNITHDSIKSVLLLNGLNIAYEKYLYIFLKEKIVL